MPVSISTPQADAVIAMLNAFADATLANINSSWSFDFMKDPSRVDLQNIRNTKITWLSSNESSISFDPTDPAYSDKWYSEAKSAEESIASINSAFTPLLSVSRLTTNLGLGTVDSILGRGSLSTFGQAAQGIASLPDAAISATALAGKDTSQLVGSTVSQGLSKLGQLPFKIVPWYVWAGAAVVVVAVVYTASRGATFKVGS